MDKFKIYGLKVIDLRNVEIVDVELGDKKIVEITGSNGSGKTTIIDAIFIALQGTKFLGKSKNGWRVIKNGKDRAEIEIVIGNENRKIEIRRSITKIKRDDGFDTGGTLTIKDSDNKPISQNFLDKLLSEFTVNPLGFAYMDAKKQVSILKELGGIDISEIEIKYKDAYYKRTEVNREVKRLDGVIKTFGDIDKIDEPVVIVDLINLRSSIDDHNRKILDINNKVNSDRDCINSLDRDICEYRNQIKLLQEKIHKRGELIKEYEDKLNSNKEKLEELSAVKFDKTIDEIDQEIKTAESINEKYRNYQIYLKTRDELEERQMESIKITEDLNKLEKEKVNIISNSKLPFSNLTFDDEIGVLIDNIPFSQMSTAEQIKISTRIGMEISPLKIIYIKEGAMLDDDSFNTISDMAFKHDYQVLVETVGEKFGDSQIVMRAGRIIDDSNDFDKHSLEE